jgi:hypothetical protein
MASFNVTRRALSLGSRDSWSGWHAVSWSTSTIEMIIRPKGASHIPTLGGHYPKLDAVGYTDDAVSVGDQIYDAFSHYYTIEELEEELWGGSLEYYVCHLSKVSMYQADFSATTWTLTRPHDPRYRMKVWMDAYLRTAQITKNDDSTTADWACIFNDPPYHIDLEFRGSSNMEGLYVIDQPESIPRIDAVTHAPYAYDEKMPIHIMTINSTGCTGTALQHKMEAELRYICETYPIPAAAPYSIRSMTVRRKRDIDIGGMRIYDTEYLLDYIRDVNT